VDDFLAALRENRIPSKRLRGRAPVARYVANTALHLNRFAEVHGREPADAISRGQIKLFLDRFTAQPATQRMTLSAIRRMFAWAIEREMVTCADPTIGSKAPGAPSREEVLSLDEVVRLWRAAEDISPVRRDAIRLLLLTGQRRSEVAGMVWGELDIAAGTWILPTARTKAKRPHVVPLPSLAVELLRARLPTTPAPGDLVLPVLGEAGLLVPLSSWGWVKVLITRATGLQDWRWHDLRRTFVTLSAEADGDINVLDRILNHAASATKGGVLGVYQRAKLAKQMRAAMTQWDTMLRAALDLPSPDEGEDKIVPLRVEAA
jgi:integrase